MKPNIKIHNWKLELYVTVGYQTDSDYSIYKCDWCNSRSLRDHDCFTSGRYYRHNHMFNTRAYLDKYEHCDGYEYQEQLDK